MGDLSICYDGLLFVVQLVEDVLTISLWEIGYIVHTQGHHSQMWGNAKLPCFGLQLWQQKQPKQERAHNIDGDLGFVIFRPSKLSSCQSCILQQDIQAR